jgi:hypothetical protein
MVYARPLGVRTLSSSTRNTPSAPRTMSRPDTPIHTPPGGRSARAAGIEVVGRADHALGDHALAHAGARAVDVVDERVERLRALDEPRPRGRSRRPRE